MLSVEDQSIVNDIEQGYLLGDYEESFAKAKQRVELSYLSNGENSRMLRLKLAGLMIDIGGASGIQEALEMGVSVMNSMMPEALTIFSKSSIEYNIGTGQQALFELQRKRGLELIPANVSLLIKAKNSLWRAYKNSSSENILFRSMLLVNLANCLNTCGRVVEALHYYDRALRLAPDLAEAHASRALALTFLSELTFGHSMNMAVQIRDNYQSAIDCSSTIPTHIVDSWVRKRDHLTARLSGHDTSADLHETENESLSHSSFWTFCLQNHLTLCEHALYCNCLGARRDDLTIPTHTTHISGDFVPAMERTLNRLKFEYHVARLMYYHGLDGSRSWDVDAYDANITTTYVGDKSVESTSVEFLRTSFRTCFGILDKIASAICRMYRLSTPKENISFHSFWKQKSNADRWERINSIDNLSLTALYTQATDLNTADGEWGLFKIWRDRLEHGMLVIVDPSVETPDDYPLSTTDDDSIHVPLEEFQSQLLELLHFVRSAIFNYTFCIRYEGIKDIRGRGGDEGVTYTFKHR